MIDLTVIQVAIIEDERVVLDSLMAFMGKDPSINVVHTGYSIEDFLSSAKGKKTTPNVILLDVNLPGISGIDGIAPLKKQYPGVNIVILTTFEDSNHIFRALKAGACSYISKQTSLLLIGEAIKIVAKGGAYMSPAIARKIVGHFAPEKKKPKNLTERQNEIVALIVEGKSYKMVADSLCVSIDTVRSHIKNIYRQLEINSKAELIRKSYNGEL